MRTQARRRKGSPRVARRHPRAALAMAALACMAPAPARAGEGLDRLSALFAREPVAAESRKESKNDKPPPVPTAVRWWSIPRPAREAAKELAASKKASVTRCMAIEQEDKVSYRFYAARRTGLFQKTEFLLTGVSEPKAVADQRREEQTLRWRMEHLRDSSRRKTASTTRNPSGYILPESK